MKVTCQLCEKGFPLADGIHVGTQSLGMIPDTPCSDAKAREAEYAAFKDDASASAPVPRADYLPVPQKFNLAMACNLIGQCFGRNLSVYHVGSSLEKRDYRDVDIRVILDDAEFDRLFPSLAPLDSCPHKTVHEPKGYVCSACKPAFKPQVPTPQLDATWSLLCASISMWLQHHSGLPVDFQIQRQTQANEEFKGRRNGIGLYYATGKI